MLVPRICVTSDQLWWHHNAKSEKTIISDKGEMSDQWFFLVELWVQDIK